jgi:hypothetical protein
MPILELLKKQKDALQAKIEREKKAGAICFFSEFMVLGFDTFII